jgi:hypothetical protein
MNTAFTLLYEDGGLILASNESVMQEDVEHNAEL